MRVGRLSAIVVFTLIVFAMFGGMVSAHHSVAGYDNKKEVTLRGTVVEFVWRNPHVVVFWDVKDSNGKVANWSGQMNSPTSMIQVGMNKNSMKRGDDIVVIGNPSKTGAPLAVIIKITRADGTLVVDRQTPQ